MLCFLKSGLPIYRLARFKVTRSCPLGGKSSVPSPCADDREFVNQSALNYSAARILCTPFARGFVFYTMGTEEDKIEFDFSTWCIDNGISRKTDTALRKEECNTLDTVKLLTEKDLREMGLPIGQRNMLLIIIRDLNSDVMPVPADNVDTTEQVEPVKAADPLNTNGGDTTNIADIRKNMDTLGAAGEEFDKLMGGLSSSSAMFPGTDAPAPPASAHVLGTAMDPRTILTVKSTSAKTVHITQFLSEKTKRRIYDRRRKFVFCTDKGDQVTIKADDRHPYTGITLSEWSAANCRLMAHLLDSTQLQYAHVTYYLAYTTQIYEYYQSYEWEAILDFDHQYRERQNHHKFMWGYIPPNCEIGLLGYPRRISKPMENLRTSKSPSLRQRSDSGRPWSDECRLFKNTNGNCPYGDKCRFKHVRASTTAREEA